MARPFSLFRYAVRSASLVRLVVIVFCKDIWRCCSAYCCCSCVSSFPLAEAKNCIFLVYSSIAKACLALNAVCRSSAEVASLTAAILRFVWMIWAAVALVTSSSCFWTTCSSAAWRASAVSSFKRVSSLILFFAIATVVPSLSIASACACFCTTPSALTRAVESSLRIERRTLLLATSLPWAVVACWRLEVDFVKASEVFKYALAT